MEKQAISLKYNIPKCKLTPEISAETIFKLNETEYSKYDNLRLKMSFNYKLNKRNRVELNFIYNSNIESEDDYGRYLLGFSYQHKL
ncbi:MAG: DUF2490 domain-containing protein [Saprospiraceae bacterium]